jgi:hypothetical protein
MGLLFLKRFILITILIYIPLQGMAWGLLGHRIVGQIAEDYLSSKAHREIKMILGHESLAMASNWADFIKSESAYNYLNNWHYINLPPGMSDEQLYQTLSQDTAVNAYTRISFLSNELKNSSLPQDKKVMYLRLLIHLVADLHQPMHTGRLKDLGGNTISLSWFGQASNLHRLWDSDLIDYQQLSYTEYAQAINFIDRKRLHELQNESLAEWVHDSYRLSEKIYSGIKSGDKLAYRYVYDYIGIANQQLLKGGIHLASLLNEIFS